ncbi:MAG: PAS domain S-box protein, partial [Proteobacteria bacterium]|nr:PAS domain S-box protein [Pseudomonadota bacterium]
IARFTIDYNLPGVEHVTIAGATHRIVDVVIAPIKDMYGKVTNMIVQHKDITERKRAEKALMESAEKFRILVENVKDYAIVMLDVGGHVADWNAGAELIKGYRADEIVGQHFSRFYPKEDVERGRPERELATAAAEGRFEDEGWRVRKDGSRFVANVIITPMRDDASQLRGFVKFTRDITARKQAEMALQTKNEEYESLNEELRSTIEELQAAAEELEAQKEELRVVSHYSRTLLETSLDSLVTISAEGKITDANTATEKITGMSRKMLIGSDFSDYFTEPETAHAGYLKVFEQEQVIDYPLAVRHTSGKITDVLYNASVYRNEQGEVLGVFAAARDISARKQAEEAISAKNKELENYIYITSHDLRSPLVNIQGFSQRLQKQADSIKAVLSDSPLTPETKARIDAMTDKGIPKTLNFIFTSVAKMDTLLNGLLHLSRTGRTIMAIKQIDINQLFKTIIGNFNFQLTELDAMVTAQDLPSCYGDENLLSQLFSNIIGNAIKYRDKNRRLVIEITAYMEFGKAIYSIRDNGSGIESRHLKKIWDVFYMVDSTLADAGEGLGLSSVKRIAEKHNGRVWAESESGKGSVFYVELQTIEFYE